MKKFVSGPLAVTIHSTVTYSIIGKNKVVAVDNGNDDIKIERDYLHLDPEHIITRLKITNTSGTMMKLTEAYPFISDDMIIGGISSADWQIFNGTRQNNDIPESCTLGKRDECFKIAADRLSEEGIMLKNYSDGDSVLSGDGITVIKAGQNYVSLEMLSNVTQLTDISLSLDCNGSLKAIRAGGIFNCLLEDGDFKITDWVRISVSGNHMRLFSEYSEHVNAVSNEKTNKLKKPSVYAITNNVTQKNIYEKLNFLSHMKAPFDYFMIGDGWQKNYGDWEADSGFSENMKQEAMQISSSGYSPGIWTAPFIADKNSKLYTEEKQLFLRHADGSVCFANIGGKEYAVLDVSSLATLEYLEMMYQRISAYGYYYHCLDYTGIFVMQKDVVLSNPTLSLVEAYTNAVSVIKKAIGDEGYLHIENGFTSPLTGIADSVCICSSNEFSKTTDNIEMFKKLVNQIVYRGYMSKWWYNSAGMLIEGGTLPRLSSDETKLLLTCEYMCSGALISGNISSNEELKLLRFVYPQMDTEVINRCAFSGEPYVTAADIEINGDYHTLCFFNWGREDVDLVFRLDSKTCGAYITHTSKYNISSYFRRSSVRGAKYDDVIKLGKIASGSVEIVKIAKCDKSHILYSDMHFSMGGEVSIEEYDSKIVVSGHNLFNCRGNYLVALSDKYICDDGKREFSFSVKGQGDFKYEKSVKSR